MLSFDERNLALCFHLNCTGEIAFGHRCRNIGDGAELRGQVCGQSIDVIGQIPPCARGAGHVRLAAELAFHTHFARHGRHLIGERGERIDHVIDRFGEFGNFALCFKVKFSFQIAVVLLPSPPWRCHAPDQSGSQP